MSNITFLEDAFPAGPHARVAWGGNNDLTVLVESSLDVLKGDQTPKGSRQRVADRHYLRAKNEFDRVAALKVVRRCMTDFRVVERILDRIDYSRPIYVVSPHPEWDDEDGVGFNAPYRNVCNAIPLTYAELIAGAIEAEVDDEIAQVANISRTKMDEVCRLQWHPVFKGAVHKGAQYVLVDDVFTLGGTLAALRSYIISSGGDVVACATVAHGKGVDQAFAIKLSTLSALEIKYTLSLNRFWKEKVGHGIQCATDGEGKAILRVVGKGSGTDALFALRDRLDQAAKEGRAAERARLSEAERRNSGSS